MLLGGSELCPVPDPAASLALQGAAFPKHGLSALMRVRSFSKTDRP
jgi:hypothetical protein